METTTWIVKGILAVLFILAGSMKLFLPKPKLLEKGMKGLVNLGEQQIKVTGWLEVTGAVGLILPGALNIYPILSGVAALCLGLMMLVAVKIHQQLKLPVIPVIVILLMCLFVAYRVFFA